MKPVLPVLREKKRYLAFEIISNQNLSSSSAHKIIKSAYLNYVGMKGYANAGFLFLNDLYNPEKKTGMIRISAKELDNLKTALVLLNKIDDKGIVIKTIKSSGIVKKLKN